MGGVRKLGGSVRQGASAERRVWAEGGWVCGHHQRGSLDTTAAPLSSRRRQPPHRSRRSAALPRHHKPVVHRCAGGAAQQGMMLQHACFVCHTLGVAPATTPQPARDAVVNQAERASRVYRLRRRLWAPGTCKLRHKQDTPTTGHLLTVLQTPLRAGKRGGDTPEPLKLVSQVGQPTWFTPSPHIMASSAPEPQSPSAPPAASSRRCWCCCCWLRAAAVAAAFSAASCAASCPCSSAETWPCSSCERTPHAACFSQCASICRVQEA